MRMATSEAELKELMIGSLGGDASAHSTLLRALAPLLHAFYGRRMNGDADLEDLVQETLLAIHTRRATYDRTRPFTAWFYAVARYRLIDHLRSRRASVPIEDVQAILVTEGFEAAAGARMDVDRLLLMLSPKQAKAIRDTHIEGNSIAEAAASAGLGESDIKVSVHRGMKTMTARIGMA